MTEDTDRAAPDAATGGSRARVPRAAALLGWAGLIPFVGLAALLHLGPEGGRLLAAHMLAFYGVAILSFLGGCRWGFAAAGLGEGPALRPLVLSVVPALYAWAAMPLGVPDALVFLAAGFVALLGADISLTRAGGAPAWWPRLRWPLSVGAAGSLIAGWLA
jgi:hypothetical protein